MANPQVENGYIRIANEIIEALCRHRIPGEGWQALLVIWRNTYGYQKVHEEITLNQFVLATGIKKPNVYRALSLLIMMGVIKKDNEKYCFVKDFDSWKPLSKKITLSKKIINVIKKDNEPLSEKITPTISKEIIKKKEIYSPVFEEIFKRYPNGDGKKMAYKHYTASVVTEQDKIDIHTALDKYLAHLKIETWKKPKNASTWFNNWTDWINPKDEMIKKSDMGKSTVKKTPEELRALESQVMGAK